MHFVFVFSEKELDVRCCSNTQVGYTPCMFTSLNGAVVWSSRQQQLTSHTSLVTVHSIGHLQHLHTGCKRTTLIGLM